MKNHLAQLALAEKYIAQNQQIWAEYQALDSNVEIMLDQAFQHGFDSAIHRNNKELTALKCKNIEQAKRHQDQVFKLKTELAELKKAQVLNHLPLMQPKTWIVDNWRDSWKWISTWCFALIAFFTSVDIPPEILAVLPDQIRSYLIAFTALCGVLGRYLNQSHDNKTYFRA